MYVFAFLTFIQDFRIVMFHVCAAKDCKIRENYGRIVGIRLSFASSKNRKVNEKGQTKYVDIFKGLNVHFKAIIGMLT